MSERKIDRRAFLRGAWFDPARRVLPRARGLPAGPPPPCIPPGLEEPCIDCQAPCLRACPDDLIRRDAERPARVYLSLLHKGCTFCGDCAAICPLVTTEGEQASRIGTAQLENAQCMAWDGVFCSSCVFACPEEAIPLDERRRPTIDAEACTGCGLCVAPCPTNAITVLAV